MTKTDLTARRELITTAIQLMFLQSGKMHFMVILVLPDGSEIPMVMPVDSIESKDAMARDLRNQVKATGAVMVAIATEAWSVVLPPKVTPEEAMAELDKHGGTISDHPERREILSLTFETEDEWWGHSWPIRRNGKVTLGEMETNRNMNGGRFGNLFGNK